MCFDKTLLTGILLILVFLNGSLSSTAQNSESEFTVDHKFGLGWEYAADFRSYMMINFIYRTQGEHKFKLGLGYGDQHLLEYRDADLSSRDVHLHNRALTASYSLPLGPGSPFYLETEFRYNWIRSQQVEQWVNLDPYRYEKKFPLYHDMNRYTTNLAICWMPRISNNFEFILSLYPSWTYIDFPNARQSDPLYIIPVRRRFQSEFENEDKKHFFAIGVKLGFNLYLY